MQKIALNIVRAIIIIAFLVPLMSRMVTDASAAGAGARKTMPDVIIDAGHGGIDGGAVGVTGSVEKDINLKVALLLRDALEQKGYNVVMIRDSDISLHDASAKTVRQKKVSDLKRRAAVAEEYPSALFISIHMNTFSQASVNGTMIYYSQNNSDSVVLAEAVREQVRQLQPKNNKKLKAAKGDLFLMTSIKNPAILVECGFLSNKAEEARLKSADYQGEMAETIAGGIESYFHAKYFG